MPASSVHGSQVTRQLAGLSPASLAGLPNVPLLMPRCGWSSSSRSQVSLECDLTLLLRSELSPGNCGQALEHRVVNSLLLRSHVLVSACSQVIVERGTDNALQENSISVRSAFVGRGGCRS